jgi:putative ABC transport system ATP-binding protein
MLEELREKNEVAIELLHLSKYYGSGDTVVKAVDDICLHVSKGEIVLVMGPSGAGKTTLLQVTGALLRPTSGSALINGENIAALPEKDLSTARLRHFGFIFQSANLFASLTALQNVELVINMAGEKGKNAQDKAKAILERLGLGHRLHHRPNKLSGGEQQRVAIARALANDPPILLADEPTANLDSKVGKSVIELLRKIAKDEGKTIIIVSHDLRIRYSADRVVWLEDGKLRPRWSEKITVDPVCLMVVESEKTEHVSNYREKHYYFCSPECEKEFEQSPEKYAAITNSKIV